MLQIRPLLVPFLLLCSLLATAGEPPALAAPAGEAVMAAAPASSVLGGVPATVQLVRRGALGLVRCEDVPAGAARQGVRAMLRREMIGDHLLVRMAPGADPALVARDLGGAVRARAGRSGPWLITVPIRQHSDLPAALTRLTADKRVTRVEPDWIVQPIGTPDDPSFAQMWGLHNTGQTGGTADADIDAPEAWDISTGSRNVLVGVIDTGIDREHPDLAANLWTNPGESGLDANGNDKRTNGIDDDGNGFVDDWHGWDFANNDNDPADDHGHGTHTAGTIGAVGDNGVGVTGVCWQVSLVGIKFLGPFGGSTAGAIASVDYARTIGCSLTSNSWGGGGYSQELSDSIAAAGAAGQLFIAAAGNDGTDNDLQPSYPASYPLDNIVSVAATDYADALVYFSCFGVTSVDLAAPGVNVLSTLPGGTYGSYSGTSMATPHVAGACALMRSINPGLSTAQLKSALLEQSDPLPSLAGKVVSGGRLNLHRALFSVAGPQVAGDAIAIVDDGNGDGILNPGESARITLTLRSCGSEPALAVVGTLSTTNGVAVIVDGQTAWGDLPLGSVSTGDGAFVVRLPASTATPYEVPVLITVTAATGGPWTFPISLPVRRSIQLGGQVLRCGTLAPIAGATVTCAGPGGGTATTGDDGTWSRIVTDGSYTVSASSPGLVLAATVAVSAPPGQTGIQLLLGQPLAAATPGALAFDLDQGSSATLPLTLANGGDLVLHATVSPESWAATGLWHRASWRSAPGKQAWYYGRDDTRTYNTGAANRGVLSLPPVTIPAESTLLSFQEWRQAETWYPFDLGQLEASTDGGTSWTTLYQSTTNTLWQQVDVSTSALAGATVQLRFTFDTLDADANDYEGWYVDNLRLDGHPLGSDWLSTTPTALLVSAGGSAPLSVRADTTGVPPGSYTGAITITSDAPLTPQLTVPVSLTVNAAPVISSGGLSLDDGSTAPAAGDGDGWPEPGETLALTVTLRNIGLGQAQGVSATLISDHDQLQIIAGSTTYADLAIGGSQLNQLPLVVRTASDCPDGTTLPMHLAVSGGAGRSWTIPLSLTVDWRGRITGTARLANGNPLADAQMAVAGRLAVSAADGTYVIVGVPAGTHTITATATGYSPARGHVTLPPDAVWDPLFGNRQLAITPTALAVTATRYGTTEGALHLASTGDLPVTWDARVVANAYGWDHSGQPGGPEYAWTDIRAIGTQVAITGDDVNVGPFPVGFAFPLYGRNFDTFRVCSNGWISFTSGAASYVTYPLPSPYAPENLIAALWADLLLTADSTVHYALPDSNRCIVQFTNVPYLGNQGLLSTFQIILHRDGTILLQYQRVDLPAFATVGIQDATRTIGLTVVANQALLQPGMAVRIRPPPADWLHVLTASGSLPAGAAFDLTAQCAPTGLLSGTYHAMVFLDSDDSDTPIQSVPVTLTVVNPNAPLADTQTVLATKETPLELLLTGSDADGDPLDYAVVLQPLHGVLSGSPPRLTYTPAAGYLGPDALVYTISDGERTSSPALVLIDVQPPPVVLPDGTTSSSAAAGGSGGCGAGALGLMALGFLGLRRRRRS